MKRGDTGRYEVTSKGGEQVRAFVPAPWPPDPPLVFEGRLQQILERVLLSLGRLDSLTTLLPDTGLFLYNYVRKEAVLSSQIEGTQSSLSNSPAGTSSSGGEGRSELLVLPRLEST